MNKTEMIEAVASETGLAKTEVAKVLNAYTDTIVKTVAEGGEYTVIGFGKFYASQRQARTGRNPSTELPPKKATLKEVAFCVKSIQLKRNNWSVLFLENSKVIEK